MKECCNWFKLYRPIASIDTSILRRDVYHQYSCLSMFDSDGHKLCTGFYYALFVTSGCTTCNHLIFQKFSKRGRRIHLRHPPPLGASTLVVVLCINFPIFLWSAVGSPAVSEIGSVYPWLLKLRLPLTWGALACQE